MNHIVLCDEKKCTGCGACENSCNSDSISMLPGADGFLRPKIDKKNCNDCGKCAQSCPVLNCPTLDRADDPEVFACWHKDETVRMKSSSGGAFSAIAELVLEKNGVVFGAAYDKNLHVHHRSIEFTSELDLLRRSKYVQSAIGTTFRQAKAYLQAQRQVLFVGTPCQIAGLYAFLGCRYQNLLTLDFICHGVPSPLVFKKYVNELEAKFGEKLKSINFREKAHGWENNLVIAETVTGNKLHLKNRNNSFFNGFILNAFLRESCYQCPVIGLPRFGDFTIADFWGIKKDEKITQEEVDKGISLVMINNELKIDLLDNIKKRVVYNKRQLSEAKNGNSPMCCPSSRPSFRDDFFKQLNDRNYKTVAVKYLTPPLKRRIIQFFKENFGIRHIAKLRKLKCYLGI